MRRTFARLVLAAFLGVAPLPAVAGGEATGSSLQPFGIDHRLPLQIRQVVPGSAAARFLGEGDVVLEVSHVPVNSLDQFKAAMRALDPGSVTVRKPTGQVVQVPASIVTHALGRTLWFQPLGPGEATLSEHRNPNKIAQPSGQFVIDRAYGEVQAALWVGDGRYVEVDLTIQTAENCQGCRLDNIAVMDLPSRTWLVPVPVTDVAAEVFPAETFYDQRHVVQPAPIMARLPLNQHDRGKVDHDFLGNALLGQYPAVFSAFRLPGYDMAEPSIVPAYRDRHHPSIQALGGRRQDFAEDRVGDLVIGAMENDSRYKGHLFFAAPRAYDGPYLVVISGRGDRRGLVRFESPVNVATIPPARALVEGPRLTPVPVGLLQ